MDNSTTSFMLAELPGALQWRHDLLAWQVNSEQHLSITAGASTDWFIDPAGSYSKDNAPVALFTPPDPTFLLSAQVTVGFGSAFDAGVLQVRVNDSLWGKLCFEYSPQRQPMIVSVVTRGVSDDSNAAIINGNTVYLRIAQQGHTTAFHYSLDGQSWQLVRYFTLGHYTNLQVGFSAQSPTGQSCTATFAAIHYRSGLLADIRNGE